jgi:very-short-patch-repair endonuclease
MLCMVPPPDKREGVADLTVAAVRIPSRLSGGGTGAAGGWEPLALAACPEQSCLMSVAQARDMRRQMSLPEVRVWRLLRSEPFRGAHFRRQVMFGPYYADFASHKARLIIEVDGSQHSTDEAISRDERRTAYLVAEGYRVLRFNTLDVLNHLGAVGVAVLAATGKQS